MITASKLRTIQMLGIGEIDTYLEERLLDAAIGKGDTVTVPESVLSQTERGSLTEAGFTVTYKQSIAEYEISWSLHDG